jgi:hypothetical protein
MIRDADMSSRPPILDHEEFAAPSVFAPENLLRQARRQKNLPEGVVPEVCVLDPDGDILAAHGVAERVQPAPDWACYHTALSEFIHEGRRFGIVGAPFAVLVAEQLFASGCRF